jgi:hypothetical protein
MCVAAQGPHLGCSVRGRVEDEIARVWWRDIADYQMQQLLGSHEAGECRRRR